MIEANFEQLFSKRTGPIKPGLDRVRRAYGILNSPSLTTPTIHIAGTNGKGSTAGFLWSLLSHAGYRVGLFTSPHLIHYRERFQVSGMVVSDEDLVRSWTKIRESLPGDLYEDLSFFELSTLIGFEFFEEKNTDLNIVEVGLGGRWDSTNICRSICSVIVSIGIDHVEFLGSSIEEIAAEKAGIIKHQGCPVFLGFGNEVEADLKAFNIIKQRAKEFGSPIFDRSSFKVEGTNIDISFDGISSQESVPATLRDRGTYLGLNFALAKAVFLWTMRQAIPKSLFSVTGSTIVRKPDEGPYSLLGRYQKLSVALMNGEVQNIIVDVGHNVDGVLKFCRSLQRDLAKAGVRRFPGIISILSDKNLNEMIDVLKGFLEPIVIFKIDHSRSLQIQDLAKRHRGLNVFDDFSQAWNYSLENWRALKLPWVLCGSIRAVGDVLAFFSVNLDSDLQPSAELCGRDPRFRLLS